MGPHSARTGQPRRITASGRCPVGGRSSLHGWSDAADTLYALIIPAIFLLTRASSPRKWSLAGWWVVCVGLATAWWAIPLAFLGKYGFNFLPYVEQSVTTTGTSSATSALSGSGVWTAYLNLNGLEWNQAALTVHQTWLIPILGAALMAATGLYGIASRGISRTSLSRREPRCNCRVLLAGVLGSGRRPVQSIPLTDIEWTVCTSEKRLQDRAGNRPSACSWYRAFAL